MKKHIVAIVPFVLVILAFFTLGFQGCLKDNCSHLTCYNGGICADGQCVCPSGYSGPNCETRDEQNSSISFKNNTPTTVSVKVDGLTKTVNAGASAIFTGPRGLAISWSAFTYGKTSTGAQIGELVEWGPFSDGYPSTGGTTKSQPLDVGSSMFFLYLKNLGAESWNKVYVNYGLTVETLDNITIPNNGTTYSVGYYRAYTNTNVRAESASYIWNWPASLPFMTNQSITLTGN
jgi:hypothetical protein